MLDGTPSDRRLVSQALMLLLDVPETLAELRAEVWSWRAETKQRLLVDHEKLAEGLTLLLDLPDMMAHVQAEVKAGQAEIRDLFAQAQTSIQRPSAGPFACATGSTLAEPKAALRSRLSASRLSAGRLPPPRPDACSSRQTPSLYFDAPAQLHAGHADQRSCCSCSRAFASHDVEVKQPATADACEGSRRQHLVKNGSSPTAVSTQHSAGRAPSAGKSGSPEEEEQQRRKKNSTSSLLLLADQDGPYCALMATLPKKEACPGWVSRRAGQLERASKMTLPPMPSGAAKKKADEEKLRQKVRASLLRADQNGQMASLLPQKQAQSGRTPGRAPAEAAVGLQGAAGSRGSSSRAAKPDVELLRSKASVLLLQAATDGSLNGTLPKRDDMAAREGAIADGSSLKSASALAAQQQPSAAAQEALRETMRGTLEGAMQLGSLRHILQQIPVC